MDASKEYQVLVRRRIPYISSILWGTITVLVLIVLLLYVFMLPTKYSSDEIAVAYYILAVPDWLKTVSAFAFGGLILTIPLYRYARLNKPAIMTMNKDTILIQGKQVDLIIFKEFIEKVYLNDLTDLFGRPKNKLQIVITTRSNKHTVLLLKNYNEADDLLEQLQTIDNAEFLFYENSVFTMHDNE